MNPKVSAIIPAYNEETTVAGVVKVCLKVPEIEEVIVVNDGSTDQTAQKVQQIKSKKVKIVNLAENQGKGAAIAEGIKGAKNEVLLFLDADLINLEPHHISSLIWPVITDRADMSVHVWSSNSLSFFYPWQLNGQRCLKVKFIKKFLKEIANSKYGVEIILNEIFKNKRIVVVPLVSSKPLHVLKLQKNEDWLRGYIKEVFQISKVFLKNKSKNYKEKFKKEFIKTLASYFKTSIKKIRQILEE